MRKERFRNVGAGKGVKARLDQETLRRMYLIERISQAEIARQHDCSPQFISQLIREYGIPRPGSPSPPARQRD